MEDKQDRKARSNEPVAPTNRLTYAPFVPSAVMPRTEFRALFRAAITSMVYSIIIFCSKYGGEYDTLLSPMLKRVILWNQCDKHVLFSELARISINITVGFSFDNHY